MAARLRSEHDVTAWTRQDIDLTRHQDVREAIGELAPEAIVNCASFNQVDAAGRRPGHARSTSTRWWSARWLDAAAALDAVLMHYSTDFVFAGTAVDAVCRDRHARAAKRLRAVKTDRRVAGGGCAEALRAARRKPVRRTASPQQRRSHCRSGALGPAGAGVRRSRRLSELRRLMSPMHRRSSCARARAGPVSLREFRARDVVRGRPGDRQASRRIGRVAEADLGERREAAGTAAAVCRAQ